MRRLILGMAVAVTSLVPTIGMADDQQIADYIKGRLQAEQQQGNLRGFNVDMRVEKGTVWFKGHVSNSQQEMTVLKAAQSAGHLGVVQVVDDIDVQQSSNMAQSVMPEPVAVAVEEQPVPTPATPLANAAYQQQPMASNLPQFQQTSRQEDVYQNAPQQSMVYQGAANGVPAARRQPMAFASSSRPAANPAPARPAPARPAPAGPQCYGGDCYGGNIGYDSAPMAAGYGGAAMPAEAPSLPGYAWPGYAAHPNYGAVTYPKQYSPSAWPYIGPFYPYPQVPLGWRKVTLEWDDGWWMLDFKDK